MTPGRFRLFLFLKIPLAFIAGIRLNQVSKEACSLSLRHRWWNQNPFKSIYFGAMAMCAEISTGLLVMNRIQAENANVSMLVTNMKADFTKKATGKITFTCTLDNEFEKTFQSVLISDEGQTHTLRSVGIDQDGDEVATFYFTWSIKRRTQK